MLHIRDVRELEDNLLRLGEISSHEVEQFLGDSLAWYERARPFEVISRQMFAQLCESIRSERGDARRIACGALRVICEQYETRPDKSRFVARFGINRVSSITSRSLRWSGATISAENYSEALELFEVAIGDSKYSDHDLVRGTRHFVREFQGSPDMFGRLADDLSCLTEVIEDRGSPEDHREVARAALVYFLEKSDTIPDDLGPVGYLDDAVVVAHALEQIEPERAVLASYLDCIISKWPFLLDVVLEAEESSHPLSEYLIVNVALLLHDAQESSHTGVALIVPDHGDFGFLIGFLIALSEAYAQMGRDEAIEYQMGDRLVDRETGEEYVFEGYRDAAFSASPRSSATHFAVRQPKRRGGRPSKIRHVGRTPGDVTVYKSIEHLAVLQPSVRATLTLRTGAASIDLGKTKLGPLERLFGATEPLTLTNDLKPVVVVSQFGRAESTAKSLSLFGVPLAEILPTGIARCEDEVQFQFWTRRGQGGRPAVMVVRSSADAMELIEHLEGEVFALVVPVRSESTDAANVSRLTSMGIRVLALVEERDHAAVETLERGDFSFWSWDTEWLGYLHWPPVQEPISHQVAKYESRLRSIQKAQMHVTTLEFAMIEMAYSHLLDFENATKRRDDESMNSACAEAFIALLGLLRSVSSWQPTDIELFGKLRAHLDAGKRWWPDRVVTTGHATLASLVAAAGALRTENPKKTFIDTWALENPRGVVLATSQMRQQIDAQDPANSLVWTSSVRRGTGECSILVPSWLGKIPMEKVLHPPAAPLITLVMYEPEVRWYEALKQRRERSQERIKRLSRLRSAIPRARKLPLSPEPMGSTEVEEPVVDRVLTTYRRRRALDVGKSGGGELVEARLVFFLGGYWAAFPPEARIHTFTHILDDSNAERLPERPVSDLQPGDLVMMVRGSDRDVVAHAADRHLPAGLRATSKLWQEALRRHVREKRDYSGLREALASHGCKRTVQTIRGWISDGRRIGPQEPLESVLRAVVSVTLDERLRLRVEECAKAIRDVRSAHISAGHELQERVRSRVREWLEDDIPPEEVVEVEEQVTLLTVETIEPEVTPFAQTHLYRLREDP